MDYSQWLQWFRAGETLCEWTLSYMKNSIVRAVGYTSSHHVTSLRTLMGRFGIKGSSGRVIAIVSLVAVGRGHVTASTRVITAAFV